MESALRLPRLAHLRGRQLWVLAVGRYQLRPRAAYLESNLGHLYQTSTEMTKTLPPDTVVQFLWEPRTYYCELDCRSDLSLDKYSHLEHLYGNVDQIAQALTAEGVTHLLIHELGLEFLQENESNWSVPVDTNEYQIFIEEYTQPVQQWGEAYSLYEFNPMTLSRRHRSKTCK